MIYPNAGKDRETAEYPYVELFRDLAAAICRPNATLVLYGYGFGDDHINRIIRDMLTIPSTHLVIIIFSDEGEILLGSENPDLLYHQLIRPWKNRLGLLYVFKHTFTLDVMIILITLVSIVSRSVALKMVQILLKMIKADEYLRTISRRQIILAPFPPPGSDKIIE